MQVFMYIMGWDDPDVCEQGVPWLVDDDEIFFGPCKRPLRELLCSEYLGAEDVCDVSQHELFFIGLNGINRDRTRKVLWVGRAKTVMTFAHAWRTLVHPKYGAMRAHPFSPLHLEPLYQYGVHIGYRHASRMHEGEWTRDLSSKKNLELSADVTDDEVRLLDATTRAEVFNRDACVLLERRFYATGAGIPLSESMLDVLRKTGFLRPNDSLDAFAVFGHMSNGDADGRRGRWLPLHGEAAASLVDLLSAEAPSQDAHSDRVGPSHSPCNSTCD